MTPAPSTDYGLPGTRSSPGGGTDVKPNVIKLRRVDPAASLSAMGRKGIMPLLLLLLTSAAAVQYRSQEAVTHSSPPVQTTIARSKISCGLTCEGNTPNNCTGFVYEPGNGTCKLFSSICHGPAVNSSQQNVYLNLLPFPGEAGRK